MGRGARPNLAPLAATVTAILVHHADPAVTRRCVASILAGTVAPRVVIVTHAAGDVAALRAIAGAEVVEAEENLGYAAGCNRGIEAARSGSPAEFVWLLNPDTVASKGALEGMLGVMASDGRLGAVSADLGEEAAGGRVSLWRGAAFPRHGAQVEFLTAASLLVRGSALAGVGGLDERFFLYWEDVDLTLRLRGSGWGLGIARGAAVEHVRGASVGNRTPVQDYYATRNGLLLVRKHAPWLLGTAAMFTAGRTLPAKVVRGEWARLRASLAGIRDGMGDVRGPRG